MANSLFNFIHAFRALRRAPGFTAAVVLTLGLGIGANTAIFSVVNTVLMRALPYEEPDRLVRMFTHNRGRSSVNSSEANFFDYRTQVHSLGSAGAYAYARWHVDDGSEPRRILVARSSTELIPMLGVPPVLGRSFGPGEDEPGAEPVAVLSHGLWQRSFGGRPDAVGEHLLFQGRPFIVIGVMPPSFRFPHETVEAWVPLQLDPSNPRARANHYLRVIGRLRDGVEIEGLQKELAAYGDGAVLEYPEQYKDSQFSVSAVGLHADMVGEIETSLLVLLAAVGFVLLIACSNVANLLLVRAEKRSRDIAIRSALGASAGRIVSQLIAESLVLSVAGGFVALFLTYASSRSMLVLAADVVPRLDEFAIDLRVLGFTAALSLFSGFLAALLPVKRILRSDIQQMLVQAGRAVTSDRAGNRMRRGLIAAEVALAVVLVIGAGVMIRSLAELQKLDTGFRTNGVLTMRVSLPEHDYDDPGPVTRFYQTLIANVEQLPGILSAGIVETLPLASQPGFWSIQIEDNVVETIGEAPTTFVQQASPGYFEALDIGLRTGRLFSDFDRPGQPSVAIVNETFLRRHFPDGKAVGKRIKMFEPGKPWIEIVGVVEDILHRGLQTPSNPKLYVPHSQASDSFYYASRSMALVVHAREDLPSFAGAIRDRVRAMDPSVVVTDIQTVAEIRRAASVDREFPTVLLSVFGLVALFLAAVGIYAMVSYAASQRTREIGVRMALGASSKDVRAMVVRESALTVAGGLGLGLIGALTTTDVLRSFLYNVSPTDPITFFCVAAILASVALIASYVPARRASRVDPMIVMRSE